MHRRSVHRGIASLALVVILALAGASPVAAADLRLLDRVAGLWSAVTEGAPAGFWDMVAGWFGSGAEKASSDSDSTERGWGSDPNGNQLTEPVAQSEDPN